MHMETLHHKSYSKEPVKYLILRVCNVTIHFEAVTLKPNRWQLRARNIRTTNWTEMVAQNAQKFCITFIQRRPNVFDVGPTLYKCYTNVFVFAGMSPGKKDHHGFNRIFWFDPPDQVLSALFLLTFLLVDNWRMIFVDCGGCGDNKCELFRGK